MIKIWWSKCDDDDDVCRVQLCWGFISIHHSLIYSNPFSAVRWVETLSSSALPLSRVETVSTQSLHWREALPISSALQCLDTWHDSALPVILWQCSLPTTKRQSILQSILAGSLCFVAVQCIAMRWKITLIASVQLKLNAVVFLRALASMVWSDVCSDHKLKRSLICILFIIHEAWCLRLT